MSSKPWVGNSVVIVDDSPVVRDELTRMYESIGVKVKGVAENGVVGLELTTKLRPDLVSLDLIMPEMDGVECYRKLRALDPSLKVIVVSWLGADLKIQDNLKDIIPSHIMHPKGGSAADLEQRLGKVYGIVPIAHPATALSEPDISADLKALNARVS